MSPLPAEPAGQAHPATLPSLARRFASGALWSTLGAVLSQSLGLLLSIVAARVLGREEFGQYGVVLATAGMFSVFAGFGLGATSTRYVAELKHADPLRAGRIIALSSLVALSTGALAAVALLIGAPYLAAKSLASPQLAGAIRMAAGLVFLGALNSAQMGALSGFEAFQKIARLNLYAAALNFLAVSVGILALGLPGALAGQLLALSLSCLLNRVALKGEAARFAVPLGCAGCGAEREVLISFSLPAVLSGLMVAPVNWVCAALLVNGPGGYAQMGIYNAAASWQRAILFLPGCLGAIALPMLAGLHGARRSAQYRQALGLNLLLNGVAALAVFALVALFSGAIMKSYGPSFASGATVLVLLGLSAVFYSLGSVIGSAIASAGSMWFGLLFNAMWAGACLTGAWFLVPRYGAVGLALAHCGAYLLHLFWQLPYLYKVKSRNEPVLS